MVAPLELADCAACPLRGPRPVMGSGPYPAALVVVGEAPGRWDVEAGRPFVGHGGLVLDKTLEAAGLPRRDVFATNAVCCRPPLDDEGRDTPPPAAAVACCRPRLLAELRQANPKIILAAGGSAARSLLRTRKGIAEIGGAVEYRPDLPAPVLPTYHPAAALHGNEDAYPDLLAATKRAAGLATGRLTLPPRDERIPWHHLTDPAATERALVDLLEGKAGFVLAIDVETGGLDVLSEPLLQVAVGNAHVGVVVEADLLRHDCGILFRRLLADDRFTWLIHNSSFDLQWLREHFGVVPPNVVDTMALALGTTERRGAVGLKRLAREWLNAPYYEADVHQYLDPDGSGWEKVPRSLLAEYAARDVVYTARMAPLLTHLCEAEGTLGLVRDLLEPAQRAFAVLERRGVLVDQRYLATLERDWTPRVAAAALAVSDYARRCGWVRTEPGKRVKHETFEPRFHKRTGKPLKPKRRVTYETPEADVPLNPASPAQLAAFLFDHLGLPEPPEGRTTGEAYRQAYPEHPITPLLADFSLKTRMLNTYVRGVGKFLRADGRVHPDIDLRGAVTGRLAMHKPALQTIPREGTAGKGFASIKRLFVPSPGHVWVDADYQALEVRVAWALSGDEHLGQAVMSGDFHRAMAARIFGLPPAAVSDAQRQQAKTTVFGIMYGTTAAGLAGRLKIDVDAAQALIDGFFAAAPKYHGWYLEQRRQALTTGRIQTVFGRVRRWPLITYANRQGILNQACNFPIQSVGSDIALRALIKLTKLLPEWGLGYALFPVHDSICCEIREGKERAAVALIREIMEAPPFATDAVFEVEVKVGNSWGTVKPWEA